MLKFLQLGSAAVLDAGERVSQARNVHRCNCRLPCQEASPLADININRLAPQYERFDGRHTRSPVRIENGISRRREMLDVSLHDVPGPLRKVRMAPVVP